MSAVESRMSADQFLVWCLDQEGKWELIDGVPIQAMAGAPRRHDRIVVNLLRLMGERLDGSDCEPTTDDVAARMIGGNIRRPDVTVGCGPSEDDALESAAPAVFLEVLSPSTQRTDFIRKPEEYKRLPTLKHFVLLDPPRAWLWTREAGGAWRDEHVIALDKVLTLSGVSVELPMSLVYRGVRLED